MVLASVGGIRAAEKVPLLITAILTPGWLPALAGLSQFPWMRWELGESSRFAGPAGKCTGPCRSHFHHWAHIS